MNSCASEVADGRCSTRPGTMYFVCHRSADAWSDVNLLSTWIISLNELLGDLYQVCRLSFIQQKATLTMQLEILKINESVSFVRKIQVVNHLTTSISNDICLLFFAVSKCTRSRNGNFIIAPCLHFEVPQHPKAPSGVPVIFISLLYTPGW
jgi:hypothetical protein